MAGESVSQTGVASTTAMMAACGRGWHLMAHGHGAALKDWLAWPLVGPAADQLMGQLNAAMGRETVGPAAAWVAIRARLVEDWLAESGASHYVILGAGLDSYAWRQDGNRTVIEIDHPASQQWKRERLEALVLDVPPAHVWAPCDFERESVADVLGRIDLGRDLPFISWIAVTPYLTPEAITATLRALPPCTLAVSYCLPEDDWTGPGTDPSKMFKAMTAQRGEALVTAYSPTGFADVLRDCGFEPIHDVGPEDSLKDFGVEAFSLGFERLALARKA
ncbi:MAG TPA: class I SAM-dependent methyltransferase [Aeromicrobium sp.]|nr:class I SAM-dependent methyltransferase [Aeromicrobium sp.]